MLRSVFILMLVMVGLRQAAVAADALPPRPTPFTFVTDQARLLSEPDARKLENGLRRYADANGPQVVVVTVPTLAGRPVADYARALGTAWGVGQRTRNNGVVVLIAAQEHQVSIQAGAGLRSQITPALTDRIISQQMAPQFKQGNYFAGLRAGLNTLLQAAAPGSAAAPASAAAEPAAAPTPADETPTASAPASEPLAEQTPFSPYGAAPTPQPTGPGLGTLLLGALVVGGGIWLLLKLFRRRRTPDFLTNRAGQTAPGSGPEQRPTPDFFPSRADAPRPTGGGGSGLGGMLATGAAAAAGAYLGNRMASGQSHTGNDLHLSGPTPPTTGPGAAGLGATPPDSDAEVNDFFGNRETTGTDYFADDTTSGPDYFSSDTSYDDSSSDDTGGGGFDDSSDNSGSW